MGGFTASGSESSTVDTKLSNMQADILAKREEQYQSFFFPELINSLEDASGDTMTSSLMAGNSAGINEQSNSAKRQLLLATGKRGISGSGAELSALAKIENATGSMLSDAYNKSKLAQINQKNNMLQLGNGMSPTPTTSAQMGQESDSWSAGGSIGG